MSAKLWFLAYVLIEHTTAFDWIPTVDNLVMLSINLWWRISTKRLNLCKKSAPIIAFSVSASIKDHWNKRRRLRLIVIVRSPYVSIVVLFAANNLRLLVCLVFGLQGKMETSDPVSIKIVYENHCLWSLTFYCLLECGLNVELIGSFSSQYPRLPSWTGLLVSCMLVVFECGVLTRVHTLSSFLTKIIVVKTIAVFTHTPLIISRAWSWTWTWCSVWIWRAWPVIHPCTGNF